MMKYFSCFLLCVMGSLPVFSQLNPLSFGVKVGIDVPMFSNKPTGQESTQGIMGGVQADYRFSESNFLAADLLFHYFGFTNLVDPEAEELQEVKNRLSVLTLPVFYKRKFMENSFVLLGVEPGYFLAESVKLDGAKIAEAARNDVQFSLLAGLGYKMDVGFTCDARFNFGLTDLYKESNTKLNMFNVSAGWMF